MTQGKDESMKYRITFQGPYLVGYQLQFDEIFLYTVTGDGLISVFRRGRLDSMFFEEFMADIPWIDLGCL
jgi:hypothetical protein